MYPPHRVLSSTPSGNHSSRMGFDLWCQMNSLSEPIGPSGSFDVGDRCHLVKEFRSLLPDVQSISEVDLDLYKDKLIRAQVETINKTGKGEELSSSNQYSVIRKLVEIVPESFETNSLTKLG